MRNLWRAYQCRRRPTCSTSDRAAEQDVGKMVQTVRCLGIPNREIPSVVPDHPQSSRRPVNCQQWEFVVAKAALKAAAIAGFNDVGDGYRHTKRGAVVCLFRDQQG